MNKRFALFCFAAFFMALICAIVLILREQKGQEDGFKKTFENSFRGVITHISSSHSTITVELDHKSKYIFVQETESYLKRDVMKFIEPGDSISKKAFSDIIFIRHYDNGDSIKMNKPE